MRVYVSSGLGNAAEAKAVSEALALDGWATTYSWWTHGSVQAEGEDRIREVAQLELNGVHTADLVVVVLPGGRGTHTEFGIALGAGIPVLLYGRSPKSFDADPRVRVMTSGQIVVGGTHDRSGVVCAFYRHPAVTLVEKALGLDGLRAEALRVWSPPITGARHG